jgi:hypothetical protein
MSKSKYSDSNLYMTTREFADLVVEALHEQNYFKVDDVAHPQDIAFAFTSVGETIGSVMSWAIKQEHDATKSGKIKRGLNIPTDLKKVALPVDDEVAPVTGNHLGYNEWKHSS